MKNAVFYFLVGSQDLYGEDVLKKVKEDAEKMTKAFNQSESIPWEIVFKGVQISSQTIEKCIVEANSDDQCAGIIAWMHTFSPSKMWIRGLSKLDKPYLHLNTQYYKEIPFESIDMDYMNTHQSAHGDREHGYITARMDIRRHVISGYWRDGKTQERMGDWMRSAIGAHFSRHLKVMRLSDNMRDVAVTEGDKVAAEVNLGWSINTYPVGELVQYLETVTDQQVTEKVNQYKEKYVLDTNQMDAVAYQAKIEIALSQMLEEGQFNAYTDNFEDLFGIEQLPGLASQNLMAQGYGFGAEGDWKTSALLSMVYQMSQGTPVACSFIEDYTYHMAEGNEWVLGSHMLEVSPRIANQQPKIKVLPLGIGSKADPARLTFSGQTGPAVLATMVDMGNRFRLIVQDIECIEVKKEMPNLPVGYAAWQLKPDFYTGNEAWILAGGTHHSVLSYDLKADHFKMWANMMAVEYIHIGAETEIDAFVQKLKFSQKIWSDHTC